MSEPITIIAWNKSRFITARIIFSFSLIFLFITFCFFSLGWVGLIAPPSFLYIIPALFFFLIAGTFVLATLISVTRCQKVYIFTNKRLSLIVRNYQILPTLMHIIFHTKLDEHDHTGNKEEPTYQLKYITKWNERSEKNIFLNTLLVKMMWHYTQRGNPGEVEELITDEIREEDWQLHRQTIFDWIEQERSIVDVRDTSLPY